MGWLMCKQDADTSYCPKEGADGIAPAATHSQEQEAFSPQYLSHVLGNRKTPKKESKGVFFSFKRITQPPLSSSSTLPSLAVSGARESALLKDRTWDVLAQ